MMDICSQIRDKVRGLYARETFTETMTMMDQQVIQFFVDFSSICRMSVSHHGPL